MSVIKYLLRPMAPAAEHRLVRQPLRATPTGRRDAPLARREVEGRGEVKVIVDDLVAVRSLAHLAGRMA
eukprot:148072-Pyramimonas_sp.AAC.1